MAITAAQVKELREMTGAGMMDCKKALTAACRFKEHFKYRTFFGCFNLGFPVG